MSSLVRQACADALAAASVAGVPVDELPTLDQLVGPTELAVGAPNMELQPAPGTPGATPRQRRLHALVRQSVHNLAERRTESATMGFDDVLTQLGEALHRPSSVAVLDALRNRFKVILIDEFQDTDAVQWDIFSTVFGESRATGALVLVGDPKQAIYRFRGADVGVYLGAVDDEGGVERYTLDTNWRSDGGVMRAQRQFFRGGTFGSAAIGYVDVEAAPANRDQRMVRDGGPPYPGLEIRVPIGSRLPRKGKLPDTPKTGRIIERDMVAHIRDLLDNAVLPAGKAGPEPRRLRPTDIAVLVTSGAQARTAQSALWRQGVPAVIAGAGSVLSSWAADQVRILLHAMERPSDLRRVRAYALSWFEPTTAHGVAEATDEELALLQEKLAGWATRLADHPVAEVLARIWSTTRVVERLLGEFEGDRHVTDLDHLAEFLYANAPNGMSGVAGLQVLLDTPPEDAGDIDVDGDVVARRVESESEAVQIMTVWKAKGLEFPVVCLPMLWRPARPGESVVYTDPASGRRTLDLAKGRDWPDDKAAKARKALSDAESAGERLRLLYVAMTRSRHHTAVWWANSSGSRTNPLSRFLFSRDADTGDLDTGRFSTGACVLPDEDRVADALGPMVSASGRSVAVTVFHDAPVPEAPWAEARDDASGSGLSVAPFDAVLSRDVRRWSFSSITLHATEVDLDPYDESASDRGAGDEDLWGEEAGDPVPSIPPAGRGGADTGALDSLRAGTAFGTFVHGVLEHVDFAAEDLDAAIELAVARETARSGLDVGGLAPDGADGRRLLVHGLHAAVDTPLGPLFDGRTLRRLAPNDRLDELGFDLRVGEDGHPPTGRDLGALVSDHLGSDHPLGAWAADLAAGSIDVRLAGYLTGSIDLVARVPGEDGHGRFVVVDYKTNQLRRRGEVPGPDDYGVRRMAEAMVDHHYPLQALLYAVALHRYLRWRIPGPGPTTRVSGAAYLFVRGMTGPGVTVSAGHPHGVFTVELPPDLVTDLSALLAGHVTSRSVR